MTEAREIELVFEPLEEGGYHVYAPDLPGLHTQGDDVDDASRNAEEALAILRDSGNQCGPALRVRVITPTRCDGVVVLS